MAKRTRIARLSVCLVSGHAGVLAGLQRQLSRPAFAAKTLRVNYDAVCDPSRWRIPRAAVYLVDAGGPRLAVEALVGVIVRRFRNSRLLVVKETLKHEKVFPYLLLGAKGIVQYSEVRSQLPRAVRVVAEGGFWVPRAVVSRFVDWILRSSAQRPAEWRGPKLSRREREVLDRLLEGLANKEIADRLHISERTVKFHVSSILAKFKVRRRADLILMSVQQARTIP